MRLQNETAAPTGIGDGGKGISKALTAERYQKPSITATEIATSIIAARFRLSPYMAKLVCELAEIGGRA